ncbi:LruC domain-containing protein [Mongoliitalea daihaiensis]|uniref:LruC domain-containing protein n=1 Tax=Mongoliitalea daihaiensis TaxID=2782006 RepID=UPI001F42FCF4|nr:LruC domain-containing protein [Mongoliitalea daihaiensis]UJP63723.1 LruC domain-containing protein [Mongoliitalea daihaiensis]
MKNLFILACLLISGSLHAQNFTTISSQNKTQHVAIDLPTVEADAELGNRSFYTCWVFQGFNTTSGTQPVISGNVSFRSSSLSNSDNSTSAAITTPWIQPMNGKISFRMRFDVSASQTRFMRLFYIPIDESIPDLQGEAVLLETVDLPSNTTTVSLYEFDIPEELLNQTVRFRISFNGNGGNNRAIVDDIVIPGNFASDPTFRCLPTRNQSDRDGDGIPDEEDDFPDDPARAYKSFITNAEYSTLKFEDLWPALGDYDFNDLVNDLRITKVTNATNDLVEMIIESRTRAIGAGFRNALGIELTGIQPNQVASVSGTILDGDLVRVSSNGLESNQTHATVILYDDAFKVLPRVGGGTGVNVETDRPMSEVTTQVITITFVPNTVNSRLLTMDMLNPFLIVNQDRGREVHLPGKQPTSLANPVLFGTGADNSALGTSNTYMTKEGSLPWAIWVNESVPYMIERERVTDGFLKLRDWANSGGNNSREWYADQPGNRNDAKIMIKRK